MMRWAAWVVVVGLLLAGCSGDSDQGARSETPSAAGTSAPGPPELDAAWNAAVTDGPFVATRPDEGVNPIDAGDRVVVLGPQQVAAYDEATGDVAWETELPRPVCASSRGVNDTGVVAVLLGADGECTEAAALDTTDGRVLWTVPIPRAEDAFGHEGSVGSDAVVVTGECAGFSMLRLTDGGVGDTVTGATVHGRCASAASDGSTVVLSSRGRLSVFDAGSGKRRSTWPAEGLGRVGDVLNEEPLVVTARFADGASFVDLSGREPHRFGRDEGWFGGEPVASYRLGDTLWVQYDDVDSLVGYDLATREETATLRVGDDATLVGSYAGQLVVTVGGDDPAGVRLWLVDPAAPAEPQVLGTLPWPTTGDGAIAGSAVVGEHLVRLWHGRLEAIPLR